jgi:hypothetical protein
LTYTADPDVAANLWHPTTYRSASPTHAQAYNLEASHNYDTGARNAGNLLSLVWAVAPITLSFEYFPDVEHPWQNSPLRWDVDANGSVQVLDLLLLVQALRENGIHHELSALAEDVARRRAQAPR